MGKRVPTRPSWTANIGMIIAEGERVRAMCEKCRGYRDVDLQALAEALGADYDLWNRTTKPCRITPGCDGRNRFYFSGRGRFSPMRDG